MSRFPHGNLDHREAKAMEKLAVPGVGDVGPCRLPFPSGPCFVEI